MEQRTREQRCHLGNHHLTSASNEIWPSSLYPTTIPSLFFFTFTPVQITFRRVSSEKKDRNNSYEPYRKIGEWMQKRLATNSWRIGLSFEQLSDGHKTCSLRRFSISILLALPSDLEMLETLSTKRDRDREREREREREIRVEGNPYSLRSDIRKSHSSDSLSVDEDAE